MKMTEEFLYHGSPCLIEEYIVPKQAKDGRKRIKENNLEAVYATDLKDLAITMGILKTEKTDCKVYLIEIEEGLEVPRAVVYDGPEPNEKMYLYKLRNDEFLKCSKIKHQYISKNPVKPLETKVIFFKDYNYLVRSANKLEKFLHFFGIL